MLNTVDIVFRRFEPKLYEQDCPGSFHDQNTYHYRLVGGVMVFRGVQLGPGWESREFNGRGLSCCRRREKEGDSVGARRERPETEELTQVWEACGCKINKLRKHYGISWLKARTWLIEAGLIELPDKATKVAADEDMPEPVGSKFLDDRRAAGVLAEHQLIAEEVAALLDRKRQDYGVDNIRKFGSRGCMIRASDKIERLINLTWKNDTEPRYEAVEDTWLDLAGYAMLGLAELRSGR